MVYGDVEWVKLFREDLLRKQKVSVLTFYIQDHDLINEKQLNKKSKLHLVSAALGSVTTDQRRPE